MTEKQNPNVTMRVRIGNNELEVSGPKTFVEKKISEFIDKQKELGLVNTITNKPLGSTKNVASETKKMSGAQFFRQLSLKTDVDRTLAAGYYLERHKGYESFTASEVSEIIRKDAKRTPPRNPNDTINSNIRKGMIMAAGDKDGKNAFVLTSDGEDEINEMLNQ